MSVSLRVARAEELEVLDAMDRQDHASHFVIQTGLEQHRLNFADPDITYLCIENEQGELCGYFILVAESDGDIIEFRRILIDQNQRGIGQIAIRAMEDYCRQRWQPRKIWLDVYEDNEIGLHLYPKMGYVRVRESIEDGRKLLFFEKVLDF